MVISNEWREKYFQEIPRKFSNSEAPFQILRRQMFLWDYQMLLKLIYVIFYHWSRSSKPFNINPPWLYVEWQEVFSTYKLAYFPVSQHSQHATWSSIYNQPQYLRFKRYCHKSVLKYLSVWYSRTHVSRSMKYLFEIKRFKCLKIIKKYHFLLK